MKIVFKQNINNKNSNDDKIFIKYMFEKEV